ncbi:MAG TPA: glycoside hydrolase family 3 N-terminal domain-containing protein [Solirubrobacterales bacterium]
MREATSRRRRAAAGALCGLAVGAFAFGVALGDGAAPAPSAAERLTTGRLAGQRIVIGFAGPRPPIAVKRMIREGEVAGVVLFAANLPNRSTGRRLTRRLQAIPRPAGLRDPLLVMADQEGGLVKRVDGAPSASAEAMGERGAAFSREQGRLTAANLREIGINVDLAPVLDVARPGGTIAATGRGFGSTAREVAATAIPFADGLRAGEVAAVAKHFPGLGAARENTDFAVQRIALSKGRLRRVDEAPFRRFVATGGEIAMLSTAIYPAFSSKPAAFSRAIATGELRSRLGFEGVSITDALGTVAVRDFGEPAKAGLAAARAGVDLLLFADYRAAARARRALARRFRSGTLDREESVRSAQRVLDLRRDLAPGR